jgi:hydroxymethylpyrimidine pyrophosphatase-like HAD family hydrolase
MPTTPPYWLALAIDLDGTLIGRNHKVHDRDLAAIRLARAAGLHVALATGRNAMESAGVLAALDLAGPGIFTSGATLADMATGQTVACSHLPYPLALEIIDFLGARGHAVLILADHPQSARPTYFHTDHGPPHRATVEWLLTHRMESILITDIPAEFRRHLIRLSIVVDVAGSDQLTRDITARFGPRLASYSLLSPYYDCQVIELFPPGTSKWSGLLRMASLLHLDPARIITIGDDLNDLPMLQNAALSFAMATAAPEVQAAAKNIAPAQPDCGVAQVIESLLRGDLNP